MLLLRKPTFTIVSLFLYRMVYITMLAFLIGITIQPLLKLVGIPGFFLFYLMVFLTCITMHELGHLLGAILSKFRISMFSVGFLKFLRIKNRWVFQLSRNFIFGGTTLAAPLNEENLDNRLILWTLGGPLFGLLYGLISFLFYFLIPIHWLEPLGSLSQAQFLLLQTWLIANGTFSILISFHSLIPEQNWPASSDGYKLLQYWQKGEDAAAIKYLYLLSGAAQVGVRPRDWPAPYMDGLVVSSGHTNRRMEALLQQYYHILDRGLIEQAGRSLDQALLLSRGEQMPSAGLYWEAAYYTAWYRQQPGLARQWLNRAQAGFLDEAQTRARAEAAILLSEGNPDEALIWVEKGLAASELSYKPGMALAERDWLEQIKAQALQASKDRSVSHQGQEKSMEMPKGLVQGEVLSASASELNKTRPRSGKGKKTAKLTLSKIGRIILLGVIPILSFSLILIALQFWVGPPACSDKILANFLCKSGYNLAMVQGLGAERKGDHEQAIQDLTAALEYHPHGRMARNLRAHLSVETGDYLQAYEDYSWMIQQAEVDPALYLQRAQVLKLQGHYEAAIEDVLTAMSLEQPDAYTQGLALLQPLFMQIGDLDAFIRKLENDKSRNENGQFRECKLGLAYVFNEDWRKLDEWLLLMHKAEDDQTIFCLEIVQAFSHLRQ